MSPFAHRHRTAALAAAVIIGAPLLIGGVAYAEPAESGRQVVFSGSGLLGVSCAANPSTGSVTIAAETSLRVVNRTGHRATLLLDGSARGEIARGSTAEVLFRRGPVSLSLKPHCVLPQRKSVRVQVIVPRPSEPEPPPVATDPEPPTDGGPDGPASRPGAATGGSVFGPAPSGGRDGRPSIGGSRDGTGSRNDARDGGPDPGSASEEPGLAADEGDMGNGTTVPALPSDGESIDGVNLAAEPLASVEPMDDKGPIGLLSLIAIVCVLGVSAGAIRAILAQRASRAGIA
jgi:hypothetical protein